MKMAMKNWSWFADNTITLEKQWKYRQLQIEHLQKELDLPAYCERTNAMWDPRKDATGGACKRERNNLTTCIAPTKHNAQQQNDNVARRQRASNRARAKAEGQRASSRPQGINNTY
jgi:hypothetical protein